MYHKLSFEADEKHYEYLKDTYGAAVAFRFENDAKFGIIKDSEKEFIKKLDDDIENHLHCEDMLQTVKNVMSSGPDNFYYIDKAPIDKIDIARHYRKCHIKANKKFLEYLNEKNARHKHN
jgi:hypothetical protein